MTSLVAGSKTSPITTRPNTRSASGSTTSPPSIIGDINIPLLVPQSTPLMTKSCATSTKRRVKYPEFAVLSAVSASPLRAPCVEIKYCNTSKPSRKLAVIGVSIIEPSGLAIKPRIPASCLICAADPRAPDSAIMKTELNDFCSKTTPSSSTTLSVPKLSIITLAIFSLARDQISTTLL